jgi:hypothetical protein
LPNAPKRYISAIRLYHGEERFCLILGFSWALRAPSTATGVRTPVATLPQEGLLSGMAQELIHGLNRATVGVLVVDEDHPPRVELLLHLEDFCGERDGVDTVVGPLTVG